MYKWTLDPLLLAYSMLPHIRSYQRCEKQQHGTLLEAPTHSSHHGKRPTDKG